MKRAWWMAGTLLAVGVAGGFAAANAGEGEIVGQDAPELQTREWINSEGRTTLADMKGEVVLVAAWKTG